MGVEPRERHPENRSVEEKGIPTTGSGWWWGRRTRRLVHAPSPCRCSARRWNEVGGTSSSSKAGSGRGSGGDGVGFVEGGVGVGLKGSWSGSARGSVAWISGVGGFHGMLSKSS